MASLLQPITDEIQRCEKSGELESDAALRLNEIISEIVRATQSRRSGFRLVQYDPPM